VPSVIGERETRVVKDRDGKERVVREDITYGALDPRCFANEGGTPITEAIFKGGGMFRQADNARVREFGATSGWGQVRGRLLGNDDGDPMIAHRGPFSSVDTDEPSIALRSPPSYFWVGAEGIARAVSQPGAAVVGQCNKLARACCIS
jgi:hypothetical protein